MSWINEDPEDERLTGHCRWDECDACEDHWTCSCECHEEYWTAVAKRLAAKEQASTSPTVGEGWRQWLSATLAVAVLTALFLSVCLLAIDWALRQ